MSQSCTSSPTLTSTGEITSQTFTTTTTSSLTTLPPITTTTLSSIEACQTLPPGVTAATPCLLTHIPITITIPGTTETVQFPITLPVEITTTFTTTFWGTSCTTIPGRAPPTKPSPPAVTPVIMTETTTQSDGSVVTETVTSTPPVNVNPNASNEKDTANKSNVAPIVGGAVGGFFGLVAIIVVILFLKRRRRWDDVFEKDDDEIFAKGARRARHASRLSLEGGEVDLEPKPYVYGVQVQDWQPEPVAPSVVVSPPQDVGPAPSSSAAAAPTVPVVTAPPQPQPQRDSEKGRLRMSGGEPSSSAAPAAPPAYHE